MDLAHGFHDRLFMTDERIGFPRRPFKSSCLDGRFHQAAAIYCGLDHSLDDGREKEVIGLQENEKLGMTNSQ